mgnify:FL=1|jgi:hypothetical protein
MRVQKFNQKVRMTGSFLECRILRRALHLSIVTRRRSLDDLPDDFWKESVQSELDLSEQMYNDLLSL